MEVVRAYGEIASALGVPPLGQGRPMKHTEYLYRDEKRRALYRVVRTADKRFFQQRWDGSRFVDGMKETRRVLYRLPELLAAEPGQWVFIVEGEKDVETLTANGAVATCNVGGAGKWSRDYSTALTGRKVAIIPDNDPAGEAHALLVANHLASHAAEVRLCRLPDMPAKADVTDYFLKGNSLADLIELVNLSPLHQPTQEAEVICLASVQPAPVEWLWSGLIPVGKVTLLSGDPSLGKSFVTLDLLARLTTGRPMPGDTLPRPPMRGLLLSCEDDPSDTIAPRFAVAAGDSTRLHILAGFRDRPGDKRLRIVSLNRDIEQLGRVLQTLRDVGLVVIDPISAYLDGTDANSNAEVRGLLASLASLANDFRAAFLIVSHLRKKDTGKALYRTAGSLAWTAAARSVLQVVEDPSERDRRVILPVKNNLTQTPAGYAYRIHDGGVLWDPDPLRVTADQFHAWATANSRGEEIVEALRNLLQPGPVAYADIEQWAQQKGYPTAALLEAKTRLGATTTRTLENHMLWELPAKAG